MSPDALRRRLPPVLNRAARPTLLPLLMGLALSAPLAPLHAAATDPPAGPPRAVPGDLVTDYAGVKVPDPYRALEDLAAPATQAWVAGQNSWTRARLDALPGLPALRAQVSAADATRSAAVNSVQVTKGGTWVYLKRQPTGTVFQLWTRQGPGGAERLVLDPAAWQQATGHPHTINNFSVSPDGRLVAAVVSVGDAELGELRFYRLATGAQVGASVPAIWGETPAAWARDGRSVLYVRGADALKPGGQPFGKQQVWQHTLAGGQDRLLMGWQAGYGPELRERDWAGVDNSSTAGWHVAVLGEGVSSASRIHIARSADLARRSATARWTALTGDADQAYYVGSVGHWLYTRTYLDAPRYRLRRYDLAHPAQAPVDVVPQFDGVIDNATVAADGVYWTVRKGSVTALYRLPHGAQAATPQAIPLPFSGAVSMFDANPDVPGLRFQLEGWTHEAGIYVTDGRRVTATSLVPPSGSPLGRDWVAEELDCRAADGVAVPMSVIHKAELPRDGRRPVILDGYGGYGIPEPAYFNRRLDAWLQAGGIWVDVKPRGGGAYGRQWYQDGVGAKKFNTWRDMIACGESMIARGWTDRAHLGISGTSMGGVAVGRAITERPDLFAVGIVRVGITDAVRFIEATTNGPNHEIEMGVTSTEAGIRQLLAMSTYAQVRDGEKYPAVLLTAGMNDNRVAPWVTFKTAARLQAATASGKPVLLRVETEGGHGVGSPADKRNAEFADLLAFALWQFGDPRFQPPTAP